MTRWFKLLRELYAASTVAGIRAVFRMLMDDAVDERLIAESPVRWRRRRGRRDRVVSVAERVWAAAEHVVRLAEQAAVLGGMSAKLVLITAAWTGCRWGELAGLERHNVDLRRGEIPIDKETGALPKPSLLASRRPPSLLRSSTPRDRSYKPSWTAWRVISARHARRSCRSRWR